MKELIIKSKDDENLAYDNAEVFIDGKIMEHVMEIFIDNGLDILITYTKKDKDGKFIRENESLKEFTLKNDDKLE